MRPVGLHLPIAGGLLRAVERARDLGCSAMQVFSSNPRSWKAGHIDDAEGARVREACARAGIDPIILHTPYLVNLASPEDVIHRRSVDALRTALLNARVLGATYVVTHVGSHRGAGVEAGHRRVAEAIRRAAAGSLGDVVLLLENSTGAGDQLAGTHDDLAGLLTAATAADCAVGVCLDTAHLWGAGYELRTVGATRKTFRLFFEALGAGRVRVVHANDSERPLGSHRDEHAFPGGGCIGPRAFRALRGLPELRGVPLIAEAPDAPPETLRQTLAFLRGEGRPPTPPAN